MRGMRWAAAAAARMGARLWVCVGLCLGPLGPVAAQETPRSGVWLEPGAYCARGVRAVVPEGYEAISFGNGVEMRPEDRRTILELSSFPRTGGMPDFDGFVARLSLPCQAGFAPSERVERRAAPDLSGTGLSALGLLERRCVGTSSAYGFLFARAALTVEGAEHDASVMVMFGDEPFERGRVAFTEEHFISEDAAAALFETVTEGLAACPITAPPPPPPPPEPTGWLGAGDHCAFTIGAAAPEGFEFRFNGLASNGGTIDLRLAGVESGYHRSKIFVWPLRGAPLAPPEESTAFDRCPAGFETTRRRETLRGADGAPINLLVEGCFSPEGQYYGSLLTTRALALPGGAHQVRGAFTIGSDDLPRSFAWNEFKSLTEAEVRTVVEGFIGSMRACEE